MKRWEVCLELIMEFLWAGLFFCGLLYLCPKLLGFLWPFVAGWFIAMLANPLRNFLEKKIKLSKKFGSALIIIIALAAIIGLLYFLVMKLIQQVQAFYMDAPKMLEEIKVQFDGLVTWIQPRLEQLGFNFEILAKGEELYNSLLNVLTEGVKGISGNGIQYAGGVAKGVTNGFVSAIVMLLSSYFFLVEREEIFRVCHEKTPKSIQEKILLIKDHIFLALGGYVKAQIKIMFIIMVLLFIGLSVIGVSYAFLLAIIISIWDVLPFLGTGMILVPWAIVKFLNYEFQKGVMLVVLYIICLLARQVLQPKIIGDSIGLKPLPTLFLIYVGLKLGGFIGFILAMIFGIILQNFYSLGFFDPWFQRVKRRFEQLKELP